MVDWVVLQDDVEKHPQFNKKPLDGILFDFGMDISQGYLVEDKTKRCRPEHWPEDEVFFGYSYRSTFTGKISKGPRYVGVARTDGKWRRFVSDLLEMPY